MGMHCQLNDGQTDRQSVYITPHRCQVRLPPSPTLEEPGRQAVFGEFQANNLASSNDLQGLLGNETSNWGQRHITTAPADPAGARGPRDQCRLPECNKSSNRKVDYSKEVSYQFLIHKNVKI